ncbi:MAG TPA: response regulator transcription factor [Phycicoccus sp.]|nr:response regulator transcription factor [Phycicoccus sp.]
MFPVPCDVVAVDNLDVVRMGLTSLQFTHPGVVRRVTTYPHVRDIDLTSAPPDVVVLDYWLGRDDESSLSHIRTLREWCGTVVLYTSEEAPARLREALREGVDGLSLKNDGTPALAGVIVEVAHGRPAWSGPLARAVVNDDAVMPRLTPEEVRVLKALAGGLTTAEIAERLHKSPSTVGTQIESIRRRYADFTGTKVNRARMLREGARDGYVDPPRARKDQGNA